LSNGCEERADVERENGAAAMEKEEGLHRRGLFDSGDDRKFTREIGARHRGSFGKAEFPWAWL
jgi:hypothetical protein